MRRVARTSGISITAQIVAAHLVVLLSLVSVATLAQRRPPTAEEMPTHLVAGKCQDCHRAIYDEWSSSGHAQAWTSKLYQETRKRFDHEKKCDPCHAPQPVLQTGVEKIPLLRGDGRERGVDCLTCHLDADGAMHGPYNDRSPFHSIQRDFVLFTKQVRLCATCHGQQSAMAHNQVKEYLTTASYATGELCQTCHMTETVRKPSRYSRTEKRSTDHSFPGSRNQARLEDTLVLDFDNGPGGVTVYLTNVAGHAVPAAPLREIRLDIQLRSAKGKLLANRVERFRHPLGVDSVPVEPRTPDIRPKADEARQYEIPASRSDLAGAELTVKARYRRSDGEPWVTIASVHHVF